MLNEEALGARVVAAYKGGSKDMEQSANRVDSYAEDIRTKYGVEIVPDIATLLDQSRRRPPRKRRRPRAHSSRPGRSSPRTSRSSSISRSPIPWPTRAKSPAWARPPIRPGSAHPACATEPSPPTPTSPASPARRSGAPAPRSRNLHWISPWYAIHPIEVLYTILGGGCESVSRTSGPDGDVIVGHWKDGRIGTVYAARPDADYGAIVFHGKDVVDLHPKKAAASEYRGLVLEIVKFFQSGKPPVSNEDTLEIFAFMDAAQRSKSQGGAVVEIAFYAAMSSRKVFERPMLPSTTVPGLRIGIAITFGSLYCILKVKLIEATWRLLDEVNEKPAH